MSDFSLHLVTDDHIDTLPDLVSIAIENGATVIQLRNKYADKLPLYEIGKKILAITRSKKIPFIINDHIDLALALDADGVHIGQSDLPYEFARKILGKHKIIGLSIQTLAHAEQAQFCDADYFGVGPIFKTALKSDVFAMGLDTLGKITSILKKPCVAIGGIQTEQVSDVISQGAAGIAVISGICHASDPGLETRKYKHELTHAKKI